MEAEKMCPVLKMKDVINGDRFYTMIKDTSLSYNHDIPKKCYPLARSTFCYSFDIISISRTRVKQKTKRARGK
ncbi:hypothetical protein SADUNF_Sadunf04G0032200 [Salix dunnii]|uniref:Uncharacterized protein n=1 Tax=Salix dunnii TaxID=1413687 RepID=A0A835N091_9ROSI|nr:hypothetical protein SADUNF_Sadunf04G0032200 [Salix dunnii]